MKTATGGYWSKGEKVVVVVGASPPEQVFEPRQRREAASEPDWVGEQTQESRGGSV